MSIGAEVDADGQENATTTISGTAADFLEHDAEKCERFSGDIML
ncbi:hypothetical protein [Rhizobium leguminosarum]|nr:hypothetical protein [Rhizobium leguminosarum]